MTECSCGAEMEKRVIPEAMWTRFSCPRCNTVEYKELRA